MAQFVAVLSGRPKMPDETSTSNRIIPHQDGMRELPRDGRDILLSDGHAVCIFDDRIFMM